MLNYKIETLADLLSILAENLDISKTEYEAAVKSYIAVGKILSCTKSPIHNYGPIIRPQGSFLLGTVTKPIVDEDDIDIDLVLTLTSKNDYWTQKDLKNVIGDYLKDSDRYKNLLDKEGKRCWTLLYRNDSGSTFKYHLDILPSVVGLNYETRLSMAKLENLKSLAINYTDKTLLNYSISTNLIDWPVTNPFGLAKWFYSIATHSKNELERALRLSIQEVPEYQSNKLILQKVIQIFKRHRDIMFNGDEDKPISIIITTLAAHAYSDNKETNLFIALKHIAENLTNYILHMNPITGAYEDYVANPVNPQENFADKWKATNNKKRNFYAWVNKLNADLDELLNTEGIENFGTLLTRSFGENLSRQTLIKFGENIDLRKRQGVGRYSPLLGITSIGDKIYSDHNFYGKNEK